MLLPKGLVVELVECRRERTLVIAGVVGDTDWHVMSALEGSDKVAAANSQNVAPDLVGVSLHHPLDDIGCLRTSGAAVRVNWCRIGEYALDLARQVLKLVATTEHQSE